MFVDVADLSRRHADLMNDWDDAVANNDDNRKALIDAEIDRVRHQLLNTPPVDLADIRGLVDFARSLMDGDPGINAEEIEGALDAAMAGIDRLGRQ